MNALTEIIKPATPAKPTKKASKPAAKGKPKGGGKAKPAKTPSSSAKQSSKGSKPAAKAAATRSSYAGMKIKALTQETGAREGSIRHLLRKAVLKATDVDTVLAKTVTHDGNEYPITGTVLTNMINLGMIKIS